MSTSTLGEQIDIHGGGIDLMYPHHEAEIAQSEGATLKIPFSRFWMHVAYVSYEGAKMSKSLGNLIMVSDLLKKYSSNAIRWYLISNHYRSSFNFANEDLENASKEFSAIVNYIKNNPEEKSEDKSYFDRFINAMQDDLDTSLASEIIKEICNKKGSVKTLKKILVILGFFKLTKSLRVV